ncbi:hypothetical protein Acor_52010 [Acrocarpospora corrugata]|uniref:Uncharacterized protein n=1 Tax=Acrocarpospora corrugata TaxID=35763 RepID=A0A5M3W276_9ACTN|nr:hypothetical protein [Acrocarpospora corrugata]GES03135.1 hypothetical protein Acor_52010 [Acrocarpospora corrugata]
MSELEVELRRAMAEETAELRISPDLVDRVVRGSQWRRRARAKLVAAALALFVAAGAGPAYLVATRGDDVVVEDVHAEINGVEIRYLPEGLGRPERAESTLGGLPGAALRWSDGDRWAEISVYRTGRRMQDGLDLLALNAMTESRTSADAVISTDGTDRMWVPQAGMLLRVTTSPSIKDELDRIASGMRVWWKGDIGDVRVTYMPDGWRSPDEIVPVNDGLARRWTFDGAGEVTVEVVYGLRAKDLKSLQEVSWPTNEQLVDLRRASVRGAEAVEGRVVGAERGPDKGRMRLWVVRPGLGVRIWASGSTSADLPRISEGIETIATTFSDSVDGMPLPALPLELRIGEETQELGQDWRGSTRYWGSRPGQGAHVAMSVYRGQAIRSEPWLRDIPAAEKEPAAVGGVAGTLLTWSETRRVNGGPRLLMGRRFVWTTETGLAIVITTVVDSLSSTAYASTDLDSVVRSVHERMSVP